jgi:hypothetical protein
VSAEDFAPLRERICTGCSKPWSEHIELLDAFYCYPFTKETSREDAVAEFTTPPEPTEEALALSTLREAVRDYLASLDAHRSTHILGLVTVRLDVAEDRLRSLSAPTHQEKPNG